MRHLRKFNEAFISNVPWESEWGDIGIDIEEIEEYLMEMSDKYEVDINRTHPLRKMFTITITNKSKSNLSNMEKDDILKSMTVFIKRSGVTLCSSYSLNPASYINGIKYTFEIK